MEGPTVQLVVTCLVDALAPDVGRATVEVLESNGCRVEFTPDQTCCGQPAFNAGFADEARKMAIHTVEVLDESEGPIVIPSGSCSAMMIHRYPEILAGTRHAEQAGRVAARIRELTQFLVDDLGIDPPDVCGGCTVAYHHSCHALRELGLGAAAEALLRSVDSVTLDGAEECCGFGGLFSIGMPAVSTAIMETKLDHVAESGVTTLVGGDIGCLLHLEGGLRRRRSEIVVKHIAEFLADPEAS